MDTMSDGKGWGSTVLTFQRSERLTCSLTWGPGNSTQNKGTSNSTANEQFGFYES